MESLDLFEARARACNRPGSAGSCWREMASKPHIYLVRRSSGVRQQLSPQPGRLELIERYGSGGQELIWSVHRNQSASNGRSVAGAVTWITIVPVFFEILVLA